MKSFDETKLNIFFELPEDLQMLKVVVSSFESSIKTEMKNLRDTFSKDIKTVNALIKASHESVKNTATTLAKIPNINDYEEKAEIEDTNTNNQ